MNDAFSVCPLCGARLTDNNKTNIAIPKVDRLREICSACIIEYIVATTDEFYSWLERRSHGTIR